MTKLERLEARLAKVNEKIFWLEMIDRLHGDEKRNTSSDAERGCTFTEK